MIGMKKCLTAGIALMLVLIFTCGIAVFAEPAEEDGTSVTTEEAADSADGTSTEDTSDAGGADAPAETETQADEPDEDLSNIRQFFDITWNADGTTEQAVYIINIPDSQWDTLDQNYTQNGYIVEETEYRGQKAMSITAAEGDLLPQYAVAAIDQGFFFTTIASAMSESTQYYLYSGAPEGEVLYTVVYHLPVAAGFHDATRTEDNGRTLAWDVVVSTEAMPVSMILYVPNTLNILVTIVLVLLLAAIIVLLILNNKKKKRLAAEAALLAEAQPDADIYDMDNAAGPETPDTAATDLQSDPTAPADAAELSSDDAAESVADAADLPSDGAEAADPAEPEEAPEKKTEE